MTDEQYTRLSNLVSATVEQQAQFSEDLLSLGEKQAQFSDDLRGLGEQVSSLAVQTAANNEGIRALLALAEMHERENQATNKRLNVLINIVERHINGNGKTP